MHGGSWAPDLVGSSLYQAPRSLGYGWSLNGSEISGATSNSIQADQVGDYRCTVTASTTPGRARRPASRLPWCRHPRSRPHRATSSSQAQAQPRERHGEADRGRSWARWLTAAGRGLAPIRSAQRNPLKAVTAAGSVNLTIKAKGKQNRKLTKTGKVTFKPG